MSDDRLVRLELAPLHGVTNRTFRKAYFDHFGGFDSAMAPFILAVDTDRAKESHFKDLPPAKDSKVPLVPQLLGNDSKAFVATAKVLADLGYGEVNWNLGCPYPMVAKKGRGSGLLPHPDRIAAFLDEACPRLATALSVKLRLGRADPGEILRVMPILNAHPLLRVIIHPRLGVQMYKGSVDLEGFARAAALSTHRLGYNGDIKDLGSFKVLKTRFPAIRDWMIGRQAVADPFLAGRIKGGPPAADPLGAMRDFHEDLYRGYRDILFGPGHVLDKMKEIWSYLGRSFGGARPALEAIGRAKTLPDYEAAVREVFEKGRWTGS